VVPRVGLDRCGKFRTQRDSITAPSSPYTVAIPTELLGPQRNAIRIRKINGLAVLKRHSIYRNLQDFPLFEVLAVSVTSPSKNPCIYTGMSEVERRDDTDNDV